MPKTPQKTLDYQKRMRCERVQAGMCMKCGKNPPASERRYCADCGVKMAAASRATQRRLREKVIAHYGGKCVCCGETTYEFLTVDHKNNDGADHRRELKVTGVATMMRWIVRNGFPDTLQILCWNCNAAKHCHGRCPHQCPPS